MVREDVLCIAHDGEEVAVQIRQRCQQAGDDEEEHKAVLIFILTPPPDDLEPVQKQLRTFTI
jgi:hypothetical protein